MKTTDDACGRGRPKRSVRGLSCARAAFLSLVVAASSCASSTPTPDDGPSPWGRDRPSLVLGEGYVIVASAESDKLVVLDPSTWTTVGMPVPVGRNPFEIDGPSSLASDGLGQVYVLLAGPSAAEPVGPHNHGASEEAPHDHDAGEEAPHDHDAGEEAPHDHDAGEEAPHDHDAGEEAPHDHDAGEEAPHDHGGHDDSGWLQRLSKVGAPPADRVDLRFRDQARLDRTPGVVAISPRGREVVTSHFDLQKAGDATLAEIDRRADLIIFPSGPLDPEMLGRRVRACGAPRGLGFAGATRARVFVACYADDTIGDFDLDDPNLLVRRTPIPAAISGTATRPFALDATRDGEVVAVGSIGSNEVLALDAASLDLMWRSPREGPVGAVAWAANGQELAAIVQVPPHVELFSRVGGATLVSSHLPEECARAEALAWGSDERLLVACSAVGGGGRVYRLSQGSLEVVEVVSLPSRPSALLVMGPT